MPRSFAHLLGLRGAAAKSADQPDDQRDDETDEEYADRKKREQDDDDAKGKGKAKGEKPDDQGDDESDEDYEKRKKEEQEEARANDDDDDSMSDGDDEDDKKDKKDAKAAAARGRERGRCAAIFGSKHAATRPDMAAHYAFATNLTRKQACKALAAVAAGQPTQATALAVRMTGMEQMRPGAGAPSGKPPVAGSWDAAAKRVGLLPK